MIDCRIDCTGDVVVGDIIQFTEVVWGGNFRNPKKIGQREIIAGVIKDSYGRKAQQHTFTIVVLGSSGDYSLDVGTKTTRKGRNIYRNGTKRCPWTNEEMREIALTEKHSRGDKARRDRERRYSEKLL